MHSSIIPALTLLFLSSFAQAAPQLMGVSGPGGTGSGTSSGPGSGAVNAAAGNGSTAVTATLKTMSTPSSAAGGPNTADYSYSFTISNPQPQNDGFHFGVADSIAAGQQTKCVFNPGVPNSGTPCQSGSWALFGDGPGFIQVGH